MRAKVGARNPWVAMLGRAGATLIGILFLATTPGGRQVNAAATPSTPPAGKETPAAAAPATVDDYFAAVSKPGLTEVKRKEVAATYEGNRATWTGYVRAVSRNKSRAGDTFLVILKSQTATEPPPKAFIASFDAASENAVTALQENQKVTVSGILSVKQNPDAPLLKDATLEK